ncbi:Centrosomal protein poc5 [Borealophlyctis nickersoniae]|nr:Centrosomal protein poc5 [Borealophlyctis nickersoniae]
MTTPKLDPYPRQPKKLRHRHPSQNKLDKEPYRQETEVRTSRKPSASKGPEIAPKVAVIDPTMATGHPVTAATPLSFDSSLRLDVDLDATKFGESLEKWTGLMRKAILADFVDAKTDLAHRHALLIERARNEVSDQLAAVNAELRDAKTVLEGYEAKVAAKERLVDSALTYLEEKRKGATLAMFMSRWRVKYADRRRLNISMRLAERHCNRVRARKAVFAWQRVTGVSWRRVVEKRIRVEAEKSMESLAEQYEKRIADLTSQLSATLTRLHATELDRARAQEDMKKAFMRGVCALNMEAMSMFRPVLGTGGDDGTDHASGGFAGTLNGGTVPTATIPTAPTQSFNIHPATQRPTYTTTSRPPNSSTPIPAPTPYTHHPHPHPQPYKQARTYQPEVYRAEMYGGRGGKGGGGFGTGSGGLVTRHGKEGKRW